MSGLSKLFNRPRKSQSTPTKTFGCLPAKLSSAIPISKRNSSPPTILPQQQQQYQQYAINNLDFVPHPVQDITTSANVEVVKPIKKKKSYNAPLTVRNPTPDEFFNMSHSLADTPSREQVTRYNLVDNKSSAPMRKPTPFARTKPNIPFNAYVTQSAEEEEIIMAQDLNDYNRENKQQKHGKMFSTKSEFEKMKQQLEDIQKERAEFKQQEKRHKRREKRMHQQILETREQLDSLMLSRSYEERATPREYPERSMLKKRNSIASTNYFQQQHQHQQHHPHYHYQYWYNDASYQNHQHSHSYTSPSASTSYFPPASAYQRYGSSLDNIYLVDHDNSPSHYSQNNTWNQQQQQQRSSYQPPSYFYDESERIPKDEIRRKSSYSRHHQVPQWSF
ncbi:hypothetical protein K501DRAFT_333216 [Backusella circina FSU 941]|nr:hypothetical protein K501DRAFT_333216 [Backusella circina FSU 941]